MALRVHHLNCATFCPAGGRLINRSPAKIVCHCLLIETDSGLVLVDTALGVRDVRFPKKYLSREFRLLVQPVLNLEETALRQIERMGFRKEDVRHIILTHLDLDHAAGLADFPAASVHLLRAEFDSATSPAKTFLERARYHEEQWAHKPHWKLYQPNGSKWFGFDSVQQLEGLPPEILMIPLEGHTRGHAGVAVQTQLGWMLHAGDAYFYHKELDGQHPQCTPGLRAFQRLMETNRQRRLWNQIRLRKLSVSQPDVRIFCAHDPTEFEQLVK